MTPAFHVAQQLVWHLRATAPYQPPSWLATAEATLFRSMAPADQFEGLAVARRLTGWGYGGDRALLIAALLHDVGKSLAPSGVQYRVACTLVEGLLPWLVAPLIRRGGTLATLWTHPDRGAHLAAEAGLPAEVVRLIRDHHAPPFDSRMAALQLADSLH